MMDTEGTPTSWLDTGPSGDPPQNSHRPEVTNGLLTTRHSDQKGENSVRPHACSPSPTLKESPALPPCGLPLCCSARTPLRCGQETAIALVLPQVNSSTAHNTDFHQILTPALGAPIQPRDTPFRHSQKSALHVVSWLSADATLQVG